MQQYIIYEIYFILKKNSGQNRENTTTNKCKKIIIYVTTATSLRSKTLYT